MRIAFHGALILLLFAFSTQHLLTLVESESVTDIYGQPLVPGSLYQILDYADQARGIEVGETEGENCTVSVIIGVDPKKVIIRSNEDAQSINVGESVSFEFEEVDPCAASAFWNVSSPGNYEYPVVIGSPKANETLGGVFRINKPEGDEPNAYYIAFALGGVDDYALVESTPEQSRDIYRLVLCHDDKYKKFIVVFKPLGNPPPPPPPPSTFVPLIRKISAE